MKAKKWNPPPCPFCGRTSVEQTSVIKGMWYYCRCRKCGSHGPTADSPKAAREKWSNRTGATA